MNAEAILHECINIWYTFLSVCLFIVGYLIAGYEFCMLYKSTCIKRVISFEYWNC